MDVKLAYLHGVLNKEIYMEQPEGFIAKGEENKVCRLVRSLYGLKQAGRVWNRTFAHTITKKLGFKTIHSDAGVYILNHHHKGGKTEMILILYVDDLLLLGEDLSKIEDVDEPPHQIRSYTLLFSLFLHFPYIADPPLHTSAPTRPRSRSHDNRTRSIGPISLI